MSRKILSDPTSTVGQNFKKARKALKLTQARFAHPLGITNSYISDLEKGKAKRPSEPLLQAIEYHYRINRDWLLTGEGEMFLEEREGKAGDATAASVDLGLLEGVIEGLELGLQNRQVELAHTRKAKLIVLLYDYFARSKQPVDPAKIQDYLSVVLE